jgi:hypothetical protein
VLRELGIPNEMLPMPDLSVVSASIKEADEHIGDLWAEFKGNNNITIEKAKQLFCEMDRYAISVGHAFYEATKGQHSLEDCLTGCGSREDHLGVPGWIPTQIRVMVDKWDQWGRLQETNK